ncbi:hypothetical protein F7725_022801 [Dissostichus mawsoni]|uniref:Transcription factor TFIIIC triple barrel domain-containing protein n=1 Tax=Dissostichus mawsoni TaxID=36200 RepID=A0A7J5YZ93_DISMA|nr:hypothetical protein F7725_022801 [Dissostichus mawsoni]
MASSSSSSSSPLLLRTAGSPPLIKTGLFFIFAQYGLSSEALGEKNCPHFRGPERGFRTFDMEDEWEEEEQIVVVELSGIINNDFLSKCRGTCKILDIDSDKPMMQVGQYVFAGEYEGKAESCPELKYMCHTAKKLMMQRIFLVEKKEGETSTGSGDSDVQMDTSCQSNQEENAKKHGKAGDIMENTDLEDSTVG